MNAMPVRRRVVVFMLGVLLLTPALFMAQVFWGAHLAFGFFRLLSPSSSFAALLLVSLSGALSAALPFGLLFGLIWPTHVWRAAALFASIPAFLVLGSAVWVGVVVHPLPSDHPSWPVRVADALLFTILFPCFAALGARLSSRPYSVLRTRVAATVFAVLAAFYYFGFDVYYRYM